MRLPLRSPPVYVFVLWSEARREQDRILADLTARFRVRDVVEVSWTSDDTFATSLTRMYGDALPPGSDKERHCGTGSFLLVVVEDPSPRFRPRHTGRGRRLLNSNVYDARLRYREWTGGGYRVHASDSVVETERNLVLLLGQRAADVTGPWSAEDGWRAHAADPVGTHGWSSREQLLQALAPYGAQPDADADADADAIRVRASDVWWAERIAGGRELRAGARQVSVAGRPVEVVFLQQPTRAVRLVNALTARIVRARPRRVRS